MELILSMSEVHIFYVISQCITSNIEDHQNIVIKEIIETVSSHRYARVG